MFELVDHTVKLASVNPRAEIHGEERVPAFDLKLEVACTSDVLIHFHPELRATLYKKQDNPDLVEQSGTDEFTALRFPKLSALKWEWEGSGYTLVVGYGIRGKSDIRLVDCKVDGLRIDAQNGGTVNLALRVIAHPESKDVGKLCEMIQQNIEVSLLPPEPETVGELFGEQKAA